MIADDSIERIWLMDNYLDLGPCEDRTIYAYDFSRIMPRFFSFSSNNLPTRPISCLLLYPYAIAFPISCLSVHMGV